jgi:TatD DNase family protein
VIDTHCHLLGDGLRGRTSAVIEEARSAGVAALITIGTTTADSLASAALADAHPNVWFTTGIHPLHAEDPRSWDDWQQAARHPRCVAWGELGLDRHYAHPETAVQRDVLDAQLARILDWHRTGPTKPVVIHCRRAVAELLPVLGASGLDPARFVFHCFTEGPADARAVLDFGAMISFTGVVTFRNAPEVAEAARLVPLDRIMCETDAPWLPPEPVRGVRPCTPAMVMHTARFLAALRGEPWDRFEEAVDANARRFFGLPHGTGR